jgi:anti-sigma factor RsiW
MTCRELAEALADFVGGELTEEQIREFCEHMDCCPPCVHYVRQYELTIQISRRLPAEPLPPRLVERLRAAMNDPLAG